VRLVLCFVAFSAHLHHTVKYPCLGMYIGVHHTEVGEIKRKGYHAWKDNTFIAASASEDEAVKQFMSSGVPLSPKDVRVFQVIDDIFQECTFAITWPPLYHFHIINL
jgi:hypothetical protein